MENKLEWLMKVPIAHRGLYDENTPENTLGAFQKAIDNGYGVELDLQMTKDGIIVVFHDYDLKRLLNLEGDILKVDFEYIKDAQVLMTTEKVPTFDEFLKLIDSQIPILIEVKEHQNIGITEQKILDCLKDYKGNFALQSEDPNIVKWFLTNAPQYTIGQLAEAISDDNDDYWNDLENGIEFFANCIDDIKRQRILDVKKKIPIIMWTASSQEDVDDCQKYYDNYIFEKFKAKKSHN